MYRIAILGCRSRGTAAAMAYHAHPGTEVVGLCDRIPERLQELGNALGVTARFADADEMIRETRPDIVAIPTGTEFHYDLCMQVLRYGSTHIDVEKPMCVDLVQADTLVRKAEEVDARIAVHHQGRCGVWMKAVVREIQKGRIGDLQHMTAYGKGYYGGYGLMNIGTHILSNFLELAGPCRRVSASALTDGHPITPEDVLPSPNGMGTIAGEAITATLEFSGNVTATLVHHRYPVIDNQFARLVIQGSEGILLWDWDGAWRMTPHGFPPKVTKHDWELLDSDGPEHYDPDSGVNSTEYSYVDEYVHALDEERDHVCSGSEAVHVIEIMMGAFESAAHGRTVELPQVDREHPLVRWRREAGLGEPEPMPRPYPEWLAAEDRRLGRGKEN